MFDDDSAYLPGPGSARDDFEDFRRDFDAANQVDLAPRALAHFR